MPLPPELQSGTRVGPYQILRELGRGGSAAVFASQTSPSAPPIALKVQRSGGSDADARFAREVRTLRELRTPGVVQVYDFGDADGLIWFAMELIDGVSLRRAIHNAPSRPARCARAAQLGAQVALTLDRVHRQGLVHRDLKPSNILVGSGDRPVILDFGVVRGLGAASHFTTPGTVLGTLPFMSPEQITGMPLGPAADIFSLGLVLYEGVLGGRRPPRSAKEWLAMQCSRRVPSLAVQHDDVPLWLSHLLDQMTALDPSDRPTAAQVAGRLERGDEQLSVWPEPADVVGRERILSSWASTLESGPPVRILSGPAGSGRRRLGEQLRRRALVRGHRSERARARTDVPGGVLFELVDRILRTPVDPGRAQSIIGPGAPALLATWPELSVHGVPRTAPPDLSQLVDAVGHALTNAAQEHRLLLVVEDLDQSDPLSLALLRRLAAAKLPRVRWLWTVEDRWCPQPVRHVLDRLTQAGVATRHSPPDLSAGAATDLAHQLNASQPPPNLPSSSPRRALSTAQRAMAQRREHAWPQPTTPLILLSFCTQPVPKSLAERLGIDVAAAVHSGAVRTTPLGRYTIASETLRARCHALTPDRAAVEDTLASAWASDGDELRAAATEASHRLSGSTPARARAPATRAALAAEQRGERAEARRWLRVIDGLPRDARDPHYQAHRFTLARCRARVALEGAGGSARRDLVEQAARRARSPSDEADVVLLQATLHAREGRPPPDALQALCTAAPSPDLHARALLTRAALRLAQRDVTGSLADLAAATRARSGRRADPLQLQLDQLRCRALGARGDGIDLAAAVKAAQPLAARMQAPRSQGVLLHLQAIASHRLGERENAAEQAWAARTLLGRAHNGEDAARNALLLARLCLGEASRGTAQRLIDEVGAGLPSLPQLHADHASASLQLAALTGDQPRVDSLLGHPPRPPSPAWRLALVGHHRAQGAYRLALQLAQRAPRAATATWASVAMDLEIAFALLGLNEARAAHTQAQTVEDAAHASGFGELTLLARLARGAANPDPDPTWDYVVARTTTARWVEIRIAGMWLDALRRERRGDPAGARMTWADLEDHARNLEHAAATRAASRALTRLSAARQDR